MELKGAKSSTMTLILGLVCIGLGGLLLARLVWTADPERLVLNEQPAGHSYSAAAEEEEEEERKMDEDREHHQDYSNGVSRMFEYNSDPHTGDCVLGTCSTTAAHSCHELKELGLPTDYYWIKTGDDGSSASAVQLLCDMTRDCCNTTGGWTRIVLLNMSDPTHKCPKQWKEITSPRRTCGRTNCEDDTTDGAGCSSAFFKTYGLEYRRVCGRVLGYQFCNTLAFWSYFHNEDEVTIDDPFVDGVTISHGSVDSRQHVWTFASALSESYEGRDAICQCTKKHYDNKSYRRVRVPPWVGTSYFCETGTTQQPPNTTEQCSEMHESAFYYKDPLWDGRGCGPASNCCNFHKPPWFCKELPRPTRDDIEVRICGSTYTSFGDTPVELVELYII